MGHSDLGDGTARRGLVIFPADEAPGRPPHGHAKGEWWLVPAAMVIAALLVVIAFAIR